MNALLIAWSAHSMAGNIMPAEWYQYRKPPNDILPALIFLVTGTFRVMTAFRNLPLMARHLTLLHQPTSQDQSIYGQMATEEQVDIAYWGYVTKNESQYSMFAGKYTKHSQKSDAGCIDSKQTAPATVCNHSPNVYHSALLSSCQSSSQPTLKVSVHFRGSL
jgi:hypothetical protein